MTIEDELDLEIEFDLDNLPGNEVDEDEESMTENEEIRAPRQNKRLNPFHSSSDDTDDCCILLD